MKTKSSILALIALIIVALTAWNAVSALAINNVEYSTLYPGSQTALRIEVENNLDEDIERVSLNLNFGVVNPSTGQVISSPFTAVGSSSDTVDNIDEGDEETFVYTIKVSNDIAPGNYQVPYTLTYYNSSGDKQNQETGTIGLIVSGNTLLTYSVSTDSPVVGQKAQLTVKIVNKGFADARFVSVKLIPEDYQLLSEQDVYIGSIDSDDSQTAIYDVIFQKENPIIIANVEYTDFDNAVRTQTIQLPLDVYSAERATELGITPKSNALFYTLLIVAIIVIWLVWRAIAKRRRMKRSMQAQHRMS